MLLFVESGESSDAMEPDADVEAAWAVEAERRWREIESGTVETIPWKEVRAELLRDRN